MVFKLLLTSFPFNKNLFVLLRKKIHEIKVITFCEEDFNPSSNGR